MHEFSVDPWLLIDASLAFTDPRLDQFVAYWHGRHVDGRLPSRRDIDPVELRPLIGQLFLIDVAGEQSVWRYRLVGTNVAERVGADATGKTIDEIFGPDYAPPVFRLYQHIVDQRLPMRAHGCVRWRWNDHLAYDSVLMPLATDGETVDTLVGCMCIL